VTCVQLLATTLPTINTANIVIDAAIPENAKNREGDHHGEDDSHQAAGHGGGDQREVSALEPVGKGWEAARAW